MYLTIDTKNRTGVENESMFTYYRVWRATLALSAPPQAVAVEGAILVDGAQILTPSKISPYLLRALPWLCGNMWYGWDGDEEIIQKKI